MHEAKLTSIKDTKIRGRHRTLLLISASNTSIAPAFSHPEVFQWFLRIAVLIFGTNLIPTIFYLYHIAYSARTADESLVLGLLRATFHLCLLL